MLMLLSAGPGDGLKDETIKRYYNPKSLRLLEKFLELKNE
jgi:hypothetical protein